MAYVAVGKLGSKFPNLVVDNLALVQKLFDAVIEVSMYLLRTLFGNTLFWLITCTWPVSKRINFMFILFEKNVLTKIWRPYICLEYGRNFLSIFQI